MAAEVRVRYAPSPTGQPHIGNIRTALFNWLFARHHGGKFIVRIEDTDQTRLVAGAVEAILDGLRWLNIDWDEGPEVDGPHAPYEQSNRLEIFQRLSEQLLDQGNAYYCHCSREALEQLRKANRESGLLLRRRMPVPRPWPGRRGGRPGERRRASHPVRHATVRCHPLFTT